MDLKDVIARLDRAIQRKKLDSPVKPENDKPGYSVFIFSSRAERQFIAAGYIFAPNVL